MENYKTFRVETKGDAIIYLRYIIINMDIYLKRFGAGIKKLEKLIEQHSFYENPCKTIDSDVYFEYRDGAGFNMGYLLNIISDHSNYAISYKKLREVFKRKGQDAVNWGIEDLEIEYQEILRDLNNKRNWVMHVPESMLYASLESIGRAFDNDPRDLIIQNPNPIGVEQFQKANGEMFLILHRNNSYMYQTFREMHQRMKQDYSKLIGSSVRLKPVFVDVLTDDTGNEMPKYSWLMQNKKYKPKKLRADKVIVDRGVRIRLTFDCKK